MAGTIRGAQVVLVLLICFGYYATWGLFIQNGTAELMRSQRDHGPQTLPGTKEPIRRAYTGVAIIDYQLTVLALFFWEMVDGSRPGASLLCFHFAGQIGAGYTILMIESLKPQNRNTVLAYIHVWGLAMQNATFALLAPFYLLIDLLLWPGLVTPSPETYLPDAASLLAIPLAMITGYLVPSVLISLPAPSIVSHDRKQLFMSIWQVFPLWVGVSHQLLKRLLAGRVSHGPRVKIAAQRSVYLFALLLAMITHISTFTAIGLSTWFPGLFAARYQGAFGFASTFVPDRLFEPSQTKTIGDGAHLLLQYDELTGSTALLLWAIAVASATRPRCSWPSDMVDFLLIALVATVLTGPIGAAAILSWLRNERVIGNNEKEVEQIRESKSGEQ